MIVGTAGHIDHGKTSLVRALTGRDTDRLPEERRRGISIELGYAFLPAEEGRTLAFVDVPGHERFVSTMLSGATGIDVALLVVAADDGVMPQTREHLEILRLLGITRGAIALTKMDLVDAARRAEVEAELDSVLEGGERAWPRFWLSSRTGQGVPELARHLAGIVPREAAGEGAPGFRLAIDRVFSLPGIGTVVTGTVHAGFVQEGDAVEIAPSGIRARVRSLHAQDQPVSRAGPGERCALNLAGIAREQAPRGAWVQAAGLANITSRIDVTLSMLGHDAATLGSGSIVHFHHGTADVLARLSVLDRTRALPGDRILAGLVLTEPLPVCRGDRFVLRDSSAQRTLGGGRVLDIDPPARHRRAPERLALLAQLRDAAPESALRALLEAGPVPIARIAASWNTGPAWIETQVARAGGHAAGGIALARERWDALREQTLEAVRSIHEREPEMPGVEQNRLRRMVAPTLSGETVAALFDELLHEKRLVRRGAFLGSPEHRAELAKEERIRWEKIKPLLMAVPFQPPRVRDIARETRLAEGEVRILLRKVARVGEVTLVAPDHFFLTDAVAKLADIAAELAADGTRAGPFRDRIGGGRKVAIQILEFFDRVGYTRRVRDDHLVRRENPWRSDDPAVS